MRKFGSDLATIEPTVKAESDESVTFSAVIAREIVHKYPEGMAYKAADELEKAAWTAQNRWVTIDQHPDTVLLMRPDNIQGRVENPEFVKNLVDPKTQRPMDRGIRADITLFKSKLPQGWVDQVKQGLKKDVSIGFTYDLDKTPGDWRGQHYDYIQRNIFIDHVAVGVPVGRCPSPYCGLGVDSLAVTPLEKRTVEPGKCPICDEIEKLGVEEASKRLAASFGSAAVDALKSEPKIEEKKTQIDEYQRSKSLVEKARSLISRS